MCLLRQPVSRDCNRRSIQWIDLGLLQGYLSLGLVIFRPMCGGGDEYTTCVRAGNANCGSSESSGDEEALKALIPLVYEELRGELQDAI